MNEKITLLLLVCFVTLSIVYSCSIVLATHATQSIDVVPARPTILTEAPSHYIKLSYPGLNWNILGDPIDDPRPHRI